MVIYGPPRERLPARALTELPDGTYISQERVRHIFWKMMMANHSITFVKQTSRLIRGND